MFSKPKIDMPTLSFIDRLSININSDRIGIIDAYVAEMGDAERDALLEKIWDEVDTARMREKSSRIAYKRDVYIALERAMFNSVGTVHPSEIPADPVAGFYAIHDTDTRCEGIVFYDGTAFFLPGIEDALPMTEVNHPTNPVAGRYNLGDRIGTGSCWKIESPVTA